MVSVKQESAFWLKNGDVDVIFLHVVVVGYLQVVILFPQVVFVDKFLSVFF